MQHPNPTRTLGVGDAEVVRIGLRTNHRLRMPEKGMLTVAERLQQTRAYA